MLGCVDPPTELKGSKYVQRCFETSHIKPSLRIFLGFQDIPFG